MDLVIEFYQNNTVLVFFVCGLGFFATGFAVALETRRASSLRVASFLPLLAAFGVLLGIAYWAEMLLAGQTVYVGERSYGLRLIRVFALAAGGLSVGQFGAMLLADADHQLRWLRWLPAALFIVWLFSTVMQNVTIAHGPPYPVDQSLCARCHSVAYSAYIQASRTWVTGADALARYLLYLPGGLLAAFGMLRLRPSLHSLRVPEIARDAGWSAVGFLVSALAVGLVPPPASFFPATVVNYATFFATIGLPVQMVSAASAVAIAIFVIRMLRVFAIEEERELERVNTARFHAQQELLEAQRQAQAETELWNMQLEAKIERRTAELARLFEEAQRREREAEALYKVSQEILALLDIDKILGSVLDNAVQLLRTDAAALALIDEQTGAVFMKATRGVCTEEFKRIRIAKGHGLAGVIVRTGQAVKLEDYEQSPKITHELDSIIKGEGVKALLGAPLKTGDRVLGILYVLQRQVHHFSDRDASLLASLAIQATIALENARLYDQVQQLAILSERGRIAREMHDGLAQVLGYLLLNSRTLANLLSTGRVPEAFEELEKMRETIREAYNDVRASILGLRNSASIERKGLLPGLADFLQEFTLHTGIVAELVVEGGQNITLAPSVETQLVRVIQEALTNVRKHAQASRAWVRVERYGDQAVVTVEDDGRGFDSTPRPGCQPSGHFGLEIMRERAESVGGSLEVVSQPGHGTRVIVRLPCALGPVQVKN